MDVNYLELFKPFEFDSTEPYLERVFETAFDRIKDLYPSSLLMASDCFRIDVLDEESNSLAAYVIGQLGKLGPLAMRNIETNETTPLSLNTKDWYE